MKLKIVIVLVVLVLALLSCGSIQITPEQKRYFKKDTDGVAIGAVRVFKNLKLTEPADQERQDYIANFWRQALQNELEKKGVKIISVPTENTLTVETEIGEKYNLLSLRTGGRMKYRVTFRKGKEVGKMEIIFSISKILGQSFLEKMMKNLAIAFAVDIKKLL
ncbi:MAG: hypothetical protein AAB474_01875 [Patescibacteria group bacterium]